MAFPKLRVPSASRQMVDVFGGYNHNLRIGDGEFYDMKNLTSDDYPVLSSRGQRGLYIHGTPKSPKGLIAKDALCYVDEGDFVINGERFDMELNDEPKQMVSMGGYVIILPDKKWINTADKKEAPKWGKIEAEVVTEEPVTFTPTRADGSAYEAEIMDNKAPGEPADGMLWVDTSATPHALKQWSESAGMWVPIASTYVKIACTGIGKAFETYDGIQISGLTGVLKTDNDDEYEIPELAELEGSAVVWDKGDDYITVVGILSAARTIVSSITISRKMPEMDFVIECGNRLWGCKYGVAANGEVVNEIYCSKLGDFKNWSCYMGISTDSWSVAVGTDGPFTGAVSHLGHPLFFKENHLHKVYISPANAHQITETTCPGVQKGCGRSLAVVGNVLYYKSRNGVCAYDGSLPTEISKAFGAVRYENAVAGSVGSKYYISMDDMEGGSHLFVYDSGKGMWHREDDLRADCFCDCRGQLYAISGEKIVSMFGGGKVEEKTVEWMAQSGIIGLTTPDMKYISRLTLRLSLPVGSSLRAFAEYDSSGRFVHLFAVHGHGTRAFTLPVRPVRCDHMRLRLEGEGPMKLFSVTKTIEQGSDVR